MLLDDLTVIVIKYKITKSLKIIKNYFSDFC